MNHPLQTTDHTRPHRQTHCATVATTTPGRCSPTCRCCLPSASCWRCLARPIAQPAHYHAFADNTWWADVPHAGDVISNLGFALVAVWGGWHLAPRRAAIGAAWFGYRLFLVALLLTAVGSTFYHLAPTTSVCSGIACRLRSACAGSACRRAPKMASAASAATRSEAALLALAAVLSVAWWHFTGPEGRRPSPVSAAATAADRAHPAVAGHPSQRAPRPAAVCRCRSRLWRRRPPN